MFKKLTPFDMEILDMEENESEGTDEFDEDAETDEDEQSDEFMDSEDEDL
jgi:hypothetical protein